MQFSFQHTMLPPRKAQSSTFHPKRFLTSELGNRPVPPPALEAAVLGNMSAMSCLPALRLLGWDLMPKQKATTRDVSFGASKNQGQKG